MSNKNKHFCCCCWYYCYFFYIFYMNAYIYLSTFYRLNVIVTTQHIIHILIIHSIVSMSSQALLVTNHQQNKEATIEEHEQKETSGHWFRLCVKISFLFMLYTNDFQCNLFYAVFGFKFIEQFVVQINIIQRIQYRFKITAVMYTVLLYSKNNKQFIYV